MPMNEYAHPEVLVSSAWLAENLALINNTNTNNNALFCLVESNEDELLYDTGHIPGAVKIDWTSDLNDPVQRDYLSAEQFAELCGRKGITPETTVVFYGDKSNWWACYAYWVFHLFGHTNCKILDGGRKKWFDENRLFTREIPQRATTTYPVPTRNDTLIRAFRNEVLEHIKAGGMLVDVRSPEEYSGERLHMPDYPNEGALRGGHIPGARNIPWAQAVQADGTFKPANELKALYENKGVVDGQGEVIAYCRIGERSSHTWFVLSKLLGYNNVRNYDGSWTEWGNGIGLPIEKGA